MASEVELDLKCWTSEISPVIPRDSHTLALLMIRNFLKSYNRATQPNLKFLIFFFVFCCLISPYEIARIFSPALSQERPNGSFKFLKAGRHPRN